MFRRCSGLSSPRRSSSAEEEFWRPRRRAGGILRRTISARPSYSLTWPWISTIRPCSCRTSPTLFKSRGKDHDGKRAQAKIIAEVQKMNSSCPLLDPHHCPGYAFDLAHMFAGFGDGEQSDQAKLLHSVSAASIEDCLTVDKARGDVGRSDQSQENCRAGE